MNMSGETERSSVGRLNTTARPRFGESSRSKQKTSHRSYSYVNSIRTATVPRNPESQSATYLQTNNLVSDTLERAADGIYETALDIGRPQNPACRKRKVVIVRNKLKKFFRFNFRVLAELDCKACSRTFDRQIPKRSARFLSRPYSKRLSTDRGIRPYRSRSPNEFARWPLPNLPTRSVCRSEVAGLLQ